MRLRRFLRDQRASAAVEMALILPAISFVMVNVVDLSVYIYTRMQVDLAAQEAVGAARVLCNTSAKLPATVNCTNLNSTMTGAAQSTTLGTGVTMASPAEGYYCANGSADLVTAGTLATPSADCSAAVGGSTTKPGDYINVTVSHSFTSIFPLASVAQLLTSPIQRTAWMRLQ